MFSFAERIVAGTALEAKAAFFIGSQGARVVFEQTQRQALHAQFGKDISLAELHHVCAIASAPKVALTNAQPHPGFAMDQVNPQAEAADVCFLCQSANRKIILVRWETFLPLFLDPFLNLLLGIQKGRVTIQEAVEL